MTITLELPPDMELELQRAARTQGKDVAAFLLDNAKRQIRRDILTPVEADLLQSINAPVDSESRNQRDALLEAKELRDLTPQEQDNLAHLIDDMELANANRWQSLADLAEMRDISLAVIAQELEIPLSKPA